MSQAVAQTTPRTSTAVHSEGLTKVWLGDTELSALGDRELTRLAVITWIEGRYNRRRRHSAISTISPVKFQAAARRSPLDDSAGKKIAPLLTQRNHAFSSFQGDRSAPAAAMRTQGVAMCHSSEPSVRHQRGASCVG